MWNQIEPKPHIQLLVVAKSFFDLPYHQLKIKGIYFWISLNRDRKPALKYRLGFLCAAKSHKLQSQKEDGSFYSKLYIF